MLNIGHDKPPRFTFIETLRLDDGHSRRAHIDAKFSPGHAHGFQVSENGPQSDYLR